jgi:hypothetical protein
MMWLIASVFVAIAIVTLLASLPAGADADEVLLGRDALGGVDGPPPVFRPRPRVADRYGVSVRVVFAEPSEESVVLDCVACRPGRLPAGAEVVDVEAGTPFTVRAQRSCSAAWADAMIDGVLSRWADRGTPVQMVVLDGPGGRELRLYDDSTRVQLPIAA